MEAELAVSSNSTGRCKEKILFDGKPSIGIDYTVNHKKT